MRQLRLAQAPTGTSGEPDFAAATRMLSVTLAVSMVGYTGLWLRLERCDAFRPGLDRDLMAFARLGSLATLVWPMLAIGPSYKRLARSRGPSAASSCLR